MLNHNNSINVTALVPEYAKNQFKFDSEYTPDFNESGFEAFDAKLKELRIINFLFVYCPNCDNFFIQDA